MNWREALFAKTNPTAYMLDLENKKLRAEIKALRQDAERYRTIRPYLEMRQHAGIWWLGETNNIGHGAFSSIDSAIDALRGEEKE